MDLETFDDVLASIGYSTMPRNCHINIMLLIEHYGGEGNRKISQAQEVKSIKKSGAE